MIRFKAELYNLSCVDSLGCYLSGLRHEATIPLALTINKHDWTGQGRDI